MSDTLKATRLDFSLIRPYTKNICLTMAIPAVFVVLNRSLMTGVSVLFSTHITGDLERAADYITYINYGELFFSGSRDEFVDMFRMVKGGREELTMDLSDKLIGTRNFSTGFEALVRSEDLKLFQHLDIEPATIDDIIVFTNQEGNYHE